MSYPTNVLLAQLSAQRADLWHKAQTDDDLFEDGAYHASAHSTECGVQCTSCDAYFAAGSDFCQGKEGITTWELAADEPAWSPLDITLCLACLKTL